MTITDIVVGGRDWTGRDAYPLPKSMILTSRLGSGLLFTPSSLDLIFAIYNFESLVNSFVRVHSSIEMVILHLPPQIHSLLYSES